MRSKIPFAGTLAVLSCFLFIQQATAEPVGQVIAVTPGAFAERAGETVPLGLKSAVHPEDTLVTDESGKLQILFDDDSSVTLAQGTRLALAAVVPQGDRPVFRANLGEGMVRFITGKIVEQNPDGFSVMTPESTIGIRGTIFAVQRNGHAGTTSVFVLNTARQVVVNGINVPGEHKITLPYGRPMPMSPADMKTVNAVASVRPPATAQTGEQAARNELAQTLPAALDSLDSPDLPVNTGSLGSSVQLADAGGSSLAESVASASSFVGSVSGKLVGYGGSGIKGNFSFDVNLGSGTLSNISLTSSGGSSTPFNAANTHGTISGNGFHANSGWTGTVNGVGITNGSMNGQLAISGSGVTVGNGSFYLGTAGPNYAKGQMTPD